MKMRKMVNLMYWYYQYNESVEHFDEGKQVMAENNVLHLFGELREWMVENEAIMEKNKRLREKGSIASPGIKELGVI